MAQKWMYNIKLSLCLVTHFAVNVCLGVDVLLQAFITTVIDGGVVRFKLRPLYPPDPGINAIGDPISPAASIWAII
jgi:hypothetical protein